MGSIAYSLAHIAKGEPLLALRVELSVKGQTRVLVGSERAWALDVTAFENFDDEGWIGQPHEPVPGEDPEASLRVTVHTPTRVIQSMPYDGSWRWVSLPRDPQPEDVLP